MSVLTFLAVAFCVIVTMATAKWIDKLKSRHNLAGKISLGSAYVATCVSLAAPIPGLSILIVWIISAIICDRTGLKAASMPRV